MSDRRETLKRAIRRHDRARMIRRAEEIARHLIGMSPEDSHVWALRRHRNVAKCSCPMCGNPRKWFGDPTIQEKRYERFDQEMN